MDEFENIFDGWADAWAWLKRVALWIVGGIVGIAVLAWLSM